MSGNRLHLFQNGKTLSCPTLMIAPEIIVKPFANAAIYVRVAHRYLSGFSPMQIYIKKPIEAALEENLAKKVIIFVKNTLNEHNLQLY